MQIFLSFPKYIKHSPLLLCSCMVIMLNLRLLIHSYTPKLYFTNSFHGFQFSFLISTHHCPNCHQVDWSSWLLKIPYKYDDSKEMNTFDIIITGSANVMRLDFCFAYTTYIHLPKREILTVFNHYINLPQSKKYLFCSEIFWQILWYFVWLLHIPRN